MVNYRIRPGETVAKVLAHIQKAIGDPRVAIAPLGESTSEPSAISDVEALSFQILTRTIREVVPDAVVAPSLVIAATDSRHYARLTNNIYRFLPLRMGTLDLGRIHGTDERVSVQNYAEIIQFYATLIRNSDALDRAVPWVLQRPRAGLALGY